tara:strand:+ start:134 stop:628 length:495 start_codon:yes stop_codon:yes gene_type:complete
MARRIRYGKGKASIEITGPQRELFEQALREVAGETMRVLEEEIDTRMKEAKENWIVRYGKPVTNKAGVTTIKKQESKRSVDKFTNGIRIVQGGKAIEGFFRNDAPYAFAIKPASYSKRDDGSASTVAEGKNLANETMWKPAKKNVNKLVKKMADAFIADQKKKG